MERAKILGMATPSQMENIRSTEKDIPKEKIKDFKKLDKELKIYPNNGNMTWGELFADEFNILLGKKEDPATTSEILEASAKILDDKEGHGFDNSKHTDLPVYLIPEHDSGKYRNHHEEGVLPSDNFREVQFGRFDFLDSQPDLLFSASVHSSAMRKRGDDLYLEKCSPEVKQRLLKRMDADGYLNLYDAYFFENFVVIESFEIGQAGYIMPFNTRANRDDIEDDLNAGDSKKQEIIKGVIEQFNEDYRCHLKKDLRQDGELIFHKEDRGVDINGESRPVGLLPWIENLFNKLNDRNDLGYSRFRGLNKFSEREKIKTVRGLRHQVK